MTYRDLEATIIDWLREAFVLDEDYVVAGDFDSLVATLRANHGTFGILTDYEGMVRDQRLGIQWRMRVTFWFRFESEAQIEGAIRSKADAFVAAIEGNSTLDGRVVTCTILDGSPPTVASRNNEFLVGVPFLLGVYERTRGR